MFLGSVNMFYCSRKFLCKKYDCSILCGIVYFIVDGATKLFLVLAYLLTLSLRCTDAQVCFSYRSVPRVSIL